jgi:hypothetical protein
MADNDDLAPDDDLLARDIPETEPSPADLEEARTDEDDEPRWSGEESLGLLPPD